MDLDAGGDDPKPVHDETSFLGRGAIGIVTSKFLFCTGYPSHCLPDFTHLLHCGLVSSHLTRRFLQLLHPVLLGSD